MPEDTPAPTPPLRQLVLIFDLTDPRHRAILRSAATAFIAGGQDRVAATIWGHLADSPEPEDGPPPAQVLPEYFDGADPAANWPVPFPTETRGMQADRWPPGSFDPPTPARHLTPLHLPVLRSGEGFTYTWSSTDVVEPEGGDDAA